MDLPSGEELVAPPPQPLGDSGKSASNAALPAKHASSPEGLSDKACLPTGPSQERRVSALQRLGKVLQTNKEHDKEHAEAAHTKKGNDKGQPEVIRNNMGNDKGKTIVGDTCLDLMHMEADEWETVRGKHTKKLLSPKSNNVQAVELHAGLSVGVSTRSGGRKHANKGQGRASSPCRLAVCWLFAFAGIEVAIQFVDAGIAGRQFSLGVIKLVICMALIG
ncbi:hypothetical protein D5086_029402 [Populus alba]|uniref:Uncharacterized protein n=1 Tax=Populus alba TaxID=43335 RepID=A0ACC4AUA5_POPAL